MTHSALLADDAAFRDAAAQTTDLSDAAPGSDAALLADEETWCSFGDTVHYSDPPKIFTGADGSYLYDSAGTEFLDLQMWYSAVNFGYQIGRAHV